MLFKTGLSQELNQECLKLNVYLLTTMKFILVKLFYHLQFKDI